ncbi:hypothetical protein M8J76_013960 [Diaphorina citri]|nr:hypothetical protein M8J76_013960 [Diaphorina citri]
MHRRRLILAILIMGCVVERIRGDGEDETILGAAKEVASDFGKHGSRVVISTLKSGGKAGTRIIGALSSAVNFGIDEAGDNFERAGHLFSKTLPEHATKIKDSTASVAEALANSATTGFQRTMSGINEVIKVSDDVSQAGLDQSVKVIHGTGDVAKSLIELGGTTGTKALGAGKYVLDTTGNVVNAPGDYIYPAVGYLNPMPYWSKLRSYFGSPA